MMYVCICLRKKSVYSCCGVVCVYKYIIHNSINDGHVSRKILLLIIYNIHSLIVCVRVCGISVTRGDSKVLLMNRRTPSSNITFFCCEALCAMHSCALLAYTHVNTPAVQLPSSLSTKGVHMKESKPKFTT